MIRENNNMEILKNNPPLMLDIIESKVETAYATFIISPHLQKTAEELSKHFIEQVFEFEKDGKMLTIEEAAEKGLIGFKIVIEKKMKDTEWILITENNRLYSKGNNLK